MIAPANQILESALSAARRGDLDSARVHYRLLLEAQPDRADGLLGLGSLELAAGRPSDAEIHFRKLLDSQPRLAEAHIGLARALSLAGRQLDAESHVRLAIDFAADSAVVWREAGILFSRMNRLAEAEDALLRASRLSPSAFRAGIHKHCKQVPGICRSAVEGKQRNDIQ